MKKHAKTSDPSGRFQYYYAAGLFLFCLLIGRFGQWGPNIKFGLGFTLFLTLLFLAPAVWFFRLYKDRKDWRSAMPCLQLSVLSVFLLYLMQYIGSLRDEERAVNTGIDAYMFWGILILFIAVSLLPFLVDRKRRISDAEIYYTLGCALLVRLFYIVLMQGHIFQNDMGGFEESSYGHLGYAYHIYAGENLLKVDPVGLDQLYHPPLYHFCTALYLRIETILGADMLHADEIAQTFSLFLSGILLLFLVKICRKLGADAAATCVAVACVSVIPYMIMNSGANNNDPLAATLCVISIYCGLCWRKSHSMKDILLMGLTIGCAMMAKMSGAMLAFSMAAFMLMVVWEDRAHFKKYIGQFAAFGAVSGITGLWHTIYNYVKFGVPFDYFPRVNESYDMFLPDFTKWQLLFDFKDGLKFLTPQYQRDNGYVEHNILLSVLKHSVFNEGYAYEATSISKFMGITVFVTVCILFAAFAVCSVIVILRKGPALCNKVLIVGCTVANALCLIKVVFAQPFVCTMNVRYIILALVTGSVTIGMAVSAKGDLQSAEADFKALEEISLAPGKAEETAPSPRRPIVLYIITLLLLLIAVEWTMSLHMLFNF